MSIDIKDVEVVGFRHAITSMRNPMNSWKESDSETDFITGLFTMGKKDHELAMKLVKAGTDHSKFMRDIRIECQISAPLYWWKEMDTYKVSTVRNSCSTMHKILEKEFTMDDFSMDKMDVNSCAYKTMLRVISELNLLRAICITPKDNEEITKQNWYKLIQLLPSSYIQTSSWSGSYQTLRNIYFARKNHKLDEWHEFCKMIEALPHSELITCLSAKDELIEKLKKENEELKKTKETLEDDSLRSGIKELNERNKLKKEIEELKTEIRNLKEMIDDLEISNKNLLSENLDLKKKLENSNIVDEVLIEKTRELLDMLKTKPKSILIFDMDKVSNWSFNPGICHDDVKLTENEYVFQTNTPPYAFDTDDIKKILEADDTKKHNDEYMSYLMAFKAYNAKKHLNAMYGTTCCHTYFEKDTSKFKSPTGLKAIVTPVETISDDEKCCDNCRWGNLEPNPYFYPCTKCEASEPSNWEPKKGGEE